MNNKFSVTTADLLSIAQAAEELKVARLTVYRWIKASKIVSVRFGGFLFIPRSEIERLMARKIVSESGE